LNNVYCATPLCNCPLQFGNQNVRLSSCQSFVGKKFPAAGLQSLSFAGPAGSPPPVLSLISKQVHPVASRSIFIGFVAFVQLRLLLYRKAYIGSTASSSTPPRIWRRLEHASDPAACPCFSAAATRQRPQDSAQQVRDGMPLIQRSGYAAVSPGFGSAGTRRCAPASATYARRRRSHARLQYRRTSVFALHKGQLHAHLVQQKLKKKHESFYSHLAPHHGAEEAVRDVATAVDVDGRYEGHDGGGGRHRRLLCAERGVHGAGRPAEEPARRRVPHHHQAPEGLLTPGVRFSADLCGVLDV
jgi:hypothetical protein